jgi:hypothetical protein
MLWPIRSVGVHRLRAGINISECRHGGAEETLSCLEIATLSVKSSTGVSPLLAMANINASGLLVTGSLTQAWLPSGSLLLAVNRRMERAVALGGLLGLFVLI